MPTLKIESDDHWHEVRRNHIGGSEVAALFYWWDVPGYGMQAFSMFEDVPDGAECVGCAASFGTGYRLWHEKKGTRVAEEFQANERIMAGIHLEPAIAAWSMEKWASEDWKVRKVHRYFQHAEVRGWGATLDYEVHGKGMPPVEIKNVDYLMFRDHWQADDDTIVSAPLQYLLQLQHQIGATDRSEGFILACVSGNNLKRGRFPKHGLTQARIAKAINDFWRSIDNDVEPYWLSNYGVVADMFREGQKETTVDLTGDEEIDELCARFLTLKEQAKGANDRLEMIKGRIAAKIGEHHRALTFQHRLTWPIIEREERVQHVKASKYRGGLIIKHTGVNAL